MKGRYVVLDSGTSLSPLVLEVWQKDWAALGIAHQLAFHCARDCHFLPIWAQHPLKTPQTEFV